MNRTTLAIALLVALPLGAATEKRLDKRAQGTSLPSERKVTIDVKDAEVKVILKDLQKQCGVRNLMIDPEVQGKGTFLFKDVPCPQAWNTVLRSLGLDSRIYANSVFTVGSRNDR